MESSSTPASRYIAQSSKKRVFPGGSSSSGFKEVEVSETAPSANRISKTMSSAKQKEVVCEIIDVDIEEDCGDAMLIDGEVDRRGKGKEALSNFSVDLSDDGSEDVGSGDDGSDSDIQMSNDVTADDFNSNLFYGEDEWIDTYYDDITYDDYSVLESHFDQMDLPTGVEVPFPWLPISPQSNTNVPAPSTSTSSSLQIQSSASHLGPDSSSSSLLLKSMWAKDQKAALHSKIGTMKEKIASTQFETIGHGRKKPTGSSSTAYLSSQSSWGTVAYKPEKEPLLSLGKSKRKSRASNVNFSPHSQFPSGGTGTLLPDWQDSPLNIAKHSVGTVGFMNESAYGTWAQVSANDQNGATPVTVEPRNLDEILQNFDLFKKFDTVGDCSDHHYAKHGSSSKQAPKYWAKKIQEEWKSLEKDLPDEIFVRVYESRMDLLRAVIVGAEGTPYHDGLFFFDVFFPVSYPNVPPHVHYHSGGLRINPNLYNCGKVCLSLLNTWSGSQKEKWIPGVSTMLQVLVSIQGLILNAKPYFNEPGFANLNGTKSGEKSSLDYNESTFIYSLQTMMYTMRRPPKHFEAFVAGHFCKHAQDILVSCKAYLDGAQVGCLVKGGVQDVDEGDKSCSQYFKSSLAGLITKLINTFTEIGAKDCQEFHSLAQKVNRPAPPPPPPAHGAVNFYKIG